MDLCIVGTGYVGLVTGVCLAEKGHRVTCVDLDADKVARINRGEPPIFEHGLEPLLQKLSIVHMVKQSKLLKIPNQSQLIFVPKLRRCFR
mgnify:CR=1 FL=1